MPRSNILPHKNPKLRIVAVTAAFLFAAVMVYMEISSRNVLSRHGVYTIATVNKVNLQTGKGGTSGYDAYYSYSLNGKSYSGSNSDPGFHRNMTGRRFFVLAAPGRTRKTVLLTDHPVPDWFTTPPPLAGWPAIPADGELRQMMLPQ